jgi:hypothetical protein
MSGGLIEISLVVTAIIASVSLCFSKIIRDSQHSRCKNINFGFGCVKCDRDVSNIEEEQEEDETPEIQPMRPTLITPNITNQTGTPPDNSNQKVALPNVSNLRKNYEKA